MISNPKTAVERLLWAYQFGHAWNRSAKYANLRNLDTGRILKMQGDEPDAKLLIASWQDFEPNVARLVEAYYGRELQPDGEVGWASETAMDIKRCAMPDFAPPSGAELAVIYDNEELRGAIESYQRYAEYRNDDKEFSGVEGSWPQEPQPRVGEAEYVGGRGSWSKGCDPKYPNWHSKRCNIIKSGFSSHQQALFADILPKLEECEAQMGMKLTHVMDGDPKAAEHDLRGQFIAGGVIGFNYFPTPNACQKGLVGRIDNSFNAAPKTLAELYTHEKDGHGDGLEHRSRTASKRSIMHPSISTPADWPTWIGDAHESTKRGYFGGVPIPSDNPPPPPPPPPPGGDVIVSRWTDEGRNYETVRKGGTRPPPIVIEV